MGRTNRLNEDLVNKAKELGLDVGLYDSDSKLQAAIDEQNADVKPSAPVDAKYYRSKIPGLSIQFGDTPDITEQPTVERFTPHTSFDQEKGERVEVGYLVTEEPDVQEILVDDPNVEEITEEEYNKIFPADTEEK